MCRSLQWHFLSCKAKVSSVWRRPDHTIPCHSQSCQFVRVLVPAAYGSNMLSGELVSWPGLPNLGQMAAHWALKSNCAAQDSLPANVLLPWLFLSAQWPVFLQSCFTCQHSAVCRQTYLIQFPSKLNGSKKPIHRM